jgi:hypothetical protein
MSKNLTWLFLILLVLILAGCNQPTSQTDLDAIVAQTLQAVEATETVLPPDTPVPTATIPVTPSDTPVPPTETPVPKPPTDAEAIIAALVDYVTFELDESDVVVEEIAGNLARGGLPGAYFIAAKEAGNWIIIHAGQSTPYCNVINPYAFPTSWIPECLDEDDSLVVRSEPEVAPELAALGLPTWTDSMDSQGRWYLVSTDNTKFTIEGGGLMMTAIEPGFDEWGVAAGAELTDFYLELTVQTGDTCSGLDRYGLIFRAPDPSRGYVAQFSCNGRFRLYKWDGSSYTGLQNWRQDDAILAGPDKENRMGVMVVGDEVKLFSNDQLLDTYTLDDYPQGRFGLVVGSSDTANFKASVDTVKFWNLGGS